MLVRTEELTSDALDWAVAVCLGAVWQPKSARASFFIWPGTSVKYSARAPRYSTDWAQGGPIIERARITVMSRNFTAPVWWATASIFPEDEDTFGYFSHTPLIAAMRCYVASRLGDEVDVPEELVR